MLDRIEANGPAFDGMEDYGAHLVVDALLDAMVNMETKRPSLENLRTRALFEALPAWPSETKISPFAAICATDSHRTICRSAKNCLMNTETQTDRAVSDPP
jgi:hypothetical protein